MKRLFNIEEKYKKILVPKKDGSFRTVWAPDKHLKKVQRYVLKRLKFKTYVSPFATAYMRKSSTLKNALPHVCKKIVLKVDIKDFFGSISKECVVRIFNIFGFADSFEIAKLCCLNDKLPQGAPTSPVISNMICKNMDYRIWGFCQKREIDYTRYSDDMAFSGNFDVPELLWFIRKVLAENGFSINDKKTKVLKQQHQQKITGVVVNEKPQVEKKLRKQLRQEVYYIRKFGLASHFKKLGIESRKGLYQLLGRVGYVLQTNPEDKEFTLYKDYLLELL